MTMIDGPFAALGIEPTRDPAVIRKAYAQAIRRHRPDEDPEGFQRMVQARDHALFLAAHGFDEDGEADDVGDAANDAAADNALADAAGEDRPPEPVSAPMTSPVIMAPVTEPAMVPAEEVSGDDIFARVERLLKLLSGAGQMLPNVWSLLLDAQDDAPFDRVNGVRFRIFSRLHEDLSVGHQAILRTGLSAAPDDVRAFLGPYYPVLTQIEDRFGVNQIDAVLAACLPYDMAFDLSAAIANANGRGLVAEEAIDAAALRSLHARDAFSDDQAMVDYIARTHAEGKAKLSFSLWALLFPVPFCFYHRLNGVGALIAVVSVIRLALKANGRADFAALASTVLVLLSIAVAVQWRRLKMDLTFDAIADRQAELARRGQTLGSNDPEIKIRVATSDLGLALGVVYTIGAVLAQLAMFRS